MSGLDQARAAFERGRPLVLVTPPAVEQAAAVWGLVGAGQPGPVTPGSGPGDHPAGPDTVIVTADHAAAAEWAAVAPAERRTHAVTGLARSASLLKAGRVGVLVGAARDLAALVSRSALKVDAVRTMVLAWPEALLGEHGATLDALLAEMPEARRIVLSWNPLVLRDLLERHARRAEVVGDAEVSPAGPARYAIVAPERRAAAVVEALDALNATGPLVWLGGPVPPPGGSCDAVIAAALPSRVELAALRAHGEPLVFVTGAQLPYLRSIAAPLTAFHLPVADRAHDQAEALRAGVAERLEQGSVDAELALLDPLFRRFDPAEVAAGLLAISRQSSVIRPPPAAPQWVKVFVNVGKKDRAGAKDFVGALIREVGLDKTQIGRIEVRESFSLVEVAADAAQEAARGLTGATIRGRRVAARLERGVEQDRKR